MTQTNARPLQAADPHRGQPVLLGGEPLQSARAAMIMVHGRGAGAEDMLGLASVLDASGVAYLAPQASQNVWYPNRFMAPLESNEPWLSSALGVLADLLDRLQNDDGSPILPERTILLGFSQGACLVLEFAARHARRYGGIVGLSGGLIGPDGISRDYPGSFDGTPVFLGCSDVDPHIPKERVELTAQVLQRMGAEVTTRLYPGMGHTVNEDEVEVVRGMMEKMRNA